MSFVSRMFTPPGTGAYRPPPTPPQAVEPERLPPPAPIISDAAIAVRERESRQRFMRRKGFDESILGGKQRVAGLGDATAPASLQRTTLLGGAGIV